VDSAPTVRRTVANFNATDWAWVLGTGLVGLPIGFKTGACLSEESFLAFGCRRKKLTLASMNAFVRLAWCPPKICRLGIRWTSENPHHVHWRHHRSDGRLLFCAAKFFRKAPGFASQRSRGGGSKQKKMNPTEHLRCALRSPGLSIKYSCKLRSVLFALSVSMPFHGAARDAISLSCIHGRPSSFRGSMSASFRENSAHTAA